MTFLAYLETLRQPLATMTGQPVAAVCIYTQQGMEEFVGNAVAAHQCALLVGYTGGQGNPDRQSGVKVTINTLEVEVWTPEIVLPTSGPLCVAIVERVMAGLHGYAGAGRTGTGTTSARVPAFQRWALRTEQDKMGARYLVGNLQFEVRQDPTADA